MKEVLEETDPGFLQNLIDSEKYDELYSLIQAALKKSFYEKTGRINLLKNMPPSFKIGGMTRKGELQQLKLQLCEFVDLLEEVYDVPINEP